MKLYTEKQIKEMLNFFQVRDEDIVQFIDKMKPIELPSDDKIDSIAPSSGIALTSNAFKLGAKWMRNKIQGGEQ